MRVWGQWAEPRPFRRARNRATSHSGPQMSTGPWATACRLRATADRPMGGGLPAAGNGRPAHGRRPAGCGQRPTGPWAAACRLRATADRPMGDGLPATGNGPPAHGNRLPGYRRTATACRATGARQPPAGLPAMALRCTGNGLPAHRTTRPTGLPGPPVHRAAAPRRVGAEADEATATRRHPLTRRSARDPAAKPPPNCRTAPASHPAATANPPPTPSARWASPTA